MQITSFWFPLSAKYYRTSQIYYHVPDLVLF